MSCGHTSTSLISIMRKQLHSSLLEGIMARFIDHTDGYRNIWARTHYIPSTSGRSSDGARAPDLADRKTILVTPPSPVKSIQSTILPISKKPVIPGIKACVETIINTYAASAILYKKSDNIVKKKSTAKDFSAISKTCGQWPMLYEYEETSTMTFQQLDVNSPRKLVNYRNIFIFHSSK